MGMIGDCLVSTHDLNRETAIWIKSLRNLEDKEIRRTPKKTCGACITRSDGRVGVACDH